MIRLIALSVVVLTAGPASAFYFPGWPGATRPPAPVLVSIAQIGDPPSVFPPETPKPPPTTPENPNNVPEPATIVMAAIGAAAIWRRTKKSPQSL